MKPEKYFFLVFGILFVWYADCTFAQKFEKKHREIPIKNFNISHLPFEFDSSLLEKKLEVYYYTGKVFNEIKGCVYLNPGEELEKDEPKLPLALRYYNDVFHHAWISRFGIFFIDSIVNRDISEYFQPFFFKQYEVTNAEYREFVYWVRDSIARRLIAEEYPEEFLIPVYDDNGNELDTYNWDINWKKEFKYSDDKYKDILQEMYLPDNERYYRRKEFDVSKFKYVYYDYDEQVKKQIPGDSPKNHSDISRFIIKKTLNIYPDTLKWIKHFKTSLVDPLTNMYFWHIAYDNYPVVGISHEQARAYCHWKTNRINKELASKKITVEVSLPNEYEWEYACLHNYSTSYKKYYYRFLDQSWETELALHPWYDINKLLSGIRNETAYLSAEDSILTEQYKILHEYFPMKYQKAETVLQEIPYSHGHYSKKERFYKKNIIGLEFNVSEWTNETRIEFTEPIAGFNRGYFFMLKTSVTSYREKMAEKDSLHHRLRMKLVRGGNWFHNKEILPDHTNPEGAKMKTFADKDSSFATVGFRYVVRIKYDLRGAKGLEKN
ncbi:MAG: SUMF1/EgtB/PvdO family nonheme iron enzyme [Bacteroidota bacterium]